ncbi:MAG: restriction endonuclease subunit S [Proteobacteria bacterium]|nr:restriction endonuclease subunit S [Pseudomonadota bacterium]
MVWPLIKISELCEILDNRRKPITKKNRIEGPYPYYGATGVLDYVEDFLFDEELVLVGEDGAKWGAGDNSAFKIAGKTWVNNHAHVLKPFKEKILEQWLIYYLNGQDLSDFITGMTVPKLNQGKLKEIPVPLPPIHEQERIVAILDQVFADIDKACANAEQNLKNARELFESYLQQVFSQRGDGWEYKSILELTSILGDGLHGTPKYTEDGGYHFINGNNLNDGQIELKERTKKVSEAEFDKYKKNLNDRTVLVSINGTLGKVAFYNNEKIILGKSACYFNLLDGINKQYVKYVIESPLFQDYAEKVATGATIKNVSLKSMRAFIIPLAPNNIQVQIVENLNFLKEKYLLLEDIYNRKISRLDELKKSILQKAFTGELTQTIDTQSPAFSANVLAFAYQQHAANKRDKTFGRVKAQKTLQLAESIAGIELGRVPIKDAAGPNDSAHMRLAEDWARQHHFFEFVQRTDGGYDFIKLDRYNKMIASVMTELKPYREELTRVIDLLINKNTEEAEVFTTVHAAWNNLIIGGADINDEAIILAARDQWHVDKLIIPKKEFQKAIQEIRSKQLVPDGTAKYVGGQANLFGTKPN